tara:strand:- start:2965 stop:3339 length:375 start_codon:yes stop_codon:yes gene_type:complete
MIASVLEVIDAYEGGEPIVIRSDGAVDLLHEHEEISLDAREGFFYRLVDWRMRYSRCFRTQEEITRKRRTLGQPPPKWLRGYLTAREVYLLKRYIRKRDDRPGEVALKAFRKVDRLMRFHRVYW